MAYRLCRLRRNIRVQSPYHGACVHGEVWPLSSRKPRMRPRIGDILEIATPAGLAYLQYTHRIPMWGALIRVLPGVFPERPSDFHGLVAKRERFFVFFAVGVAVARGIVTVVGNEE